MPQLFHRRWSRLARIAFFGGPIFLAAIVWIAAGTINSPRLTRVGVPVEQPVPFSHQHHAGRLSIDCRYCHETVEHSAFAGMPSTEVCMDCHSHIWTGLRAVEPVTSSFQTKIPLAWRRVHDVPDFSFFDHSIHVQKGIGCVTCYGRVDRMRVVHQTETLRMQWCLECHRNPEQYVRPREFVFDIEWEMPDDPQELEELGRSLGIDPPPTTPGKLRAVLVERYDIQRYTSCSNCHQ